ncbi:hypothetical protein ACFVHI_28560 [Kitasatospora sp. NPDC127121]|uniref:hypothetical protein n=1 Tax=Kitasatospora sp. NPDC127121 TaxID=3345371 RepID=UPI00364035B1
MFSGQAPAALPVVLIFFSATAAAAYAIKTLARNPTRLAVVISALAALITALPPVIKEFNGAPSSASTVDSSRVLGRTVRGIGCSGVHADLQTPPVVGVE